EAVHGGVLALAVHVRVISLASWRRIIALLDRALIPTGRLLLKFESSGKSRDQRGQCRNVQDIHRSSFSFPVMSWASVRSRPAEPPRSCHIERAPRSRGAPQLRLGADLRTQALLLLPELGGELGTE